MAIPLESLGARFGTALGRGLPGALNQLAEYKMKSISDRNKKEEYAKRKSSLEKAGISPTLADMILNDPKIAQELIPRLAESGYFDTSEFSDIINQSQQSMNIPQAAPVNQASAVQQLLSNAQQAPQQKISPLDMLNLLNSSGAGGLTLPQQQRQPQAQGLSPQQQVAMSPSQQQNIAQPRKPSVSEALGKASQIKNDAALKREKFETEKQQVQQNKIDKQNEPYLKQVRKDIPKYKEMLDTTREILDILETGKGASGLVGGFQETGVGKYFKNEETTRLAELYDKLAKAEITGMGPATAAKLRFAKGLKPELYKTPAAQKRGAQAFYDAAQTALKENEIINDIIEANNGNQPKNLEKLTDRIMKSWNELPKDSSYEDGTIINSHGIDWVRQGNDWILA